MLAQSKMQRMSTQDNIDKLNDAIASGARSVTLGGQTITYNTTDSLIKARDDAIKQLNATKPKSRFRQTYLYQSGRGYD